MENEEQLADMTTTSEETNNSEYISSYDDEKYFLFKKAVEGYVEDPEPLKNLLEDIRILDCFTMISMVLAENYNTAYPLSVAAFKTLYEHFSTNKILCLTYRVMFLATLYGMSHVEERSLDYYEEIKDTLNEKAVSAISINTSLQKNFLQKMRQDILNEK